jgi:L-fucose isomerase-like protein
MKNTETQKAFFLNFIRNINQKEKTKKHVSTYIDDPILIKTLLWLEENLPKYKVLVDELTCEEKRLIIKARIQGTKTNTRHKMSINVVMGCQIQAQKIVWHWLIVDELSLIQQIERLSGNILTTTNGDQ